MLQQNPLFQQLTQEHEELKELLKTAEECEPSERKNILVHIEHALVPHARGEEKTLYALMQERAQEGEAKELTSEAYEEHHVVDKLLADLKATDVKDEQWVAKLKVLKENIEHHAEEEENQLFQQAQKIFSAQEFQDILEAYQSSKQAYEDTLPTQAQINSRSPSQSLS